MGSNGSNTDRTSARELASALVKLRHARIESNRQYAQSQMKIEALLNRLELVQRSQSEQHASVDTNPRKPSEFEQKTRHHLDEATERLKLLRAFVDDLIRRQPKT